LEIKTEVSEERIEKFIRSVMENYPEHSSPSLQCVKWKYEDCEYTFWDVEEEDDEGNEVYHVVDYPKLRKGFEKLINKGLNPGEHGGFYVYGWDPVHFFDEYWDDWECTWDAEVTDGLVQCAIFGDVIYG